MLEKLIGRLVSIPGGPLNMNAFVASEQEIAQSSAENHEPEIGQDCCGASR